MNKFLLIIALLISVLGLNAQDVTIGDLKLTITSETPLTLYAVWSKAYKEADTMESY